MLVLITVFICFLNYTPGTFLTGWDTLHPEFNFDLNFKRLFFGVWHSEQGLGAIPAHAQMSDLPRVLILYLFHFILPLNFLRYSYIFLCFIIGPLGIYFLIKSIFQKHHHFEIIAFISALLYIFNLSTVQQFYVPFEMFPTQWAFLPWIIFFSLKYLQHSKTFYLISFSLFTIFATPQSYAPQLWYAFFVIYSLFLILYSLLNKNHFKKSLKLIIFTLFLNAFWLIPNIFYIITSNSSPQINRDNRLYSQEFLLKNRQNGDIADVAIIKGFYFDWSVFNLDRSTFGNLMPNWNQHLSNPFICAIGYFVFIISLFGLIMAFIKRDKLFISLSPFFIVPFGLLGNKIPIFSQVFDFLIQNSTIRESFRFIFTKLSILLLFGFILFFSYSINLIFEKLKSLKKKTYFSIFISILFFIYGFPIFQGQLISKKVRLNFPNDYFQMWQFMSTKEDGRILSLPLNQSSGWQYYNWGYQGSGFLWFNLKQDLLDRDSDRWNTKNEQSYKEFFNSLYGQRYQQFSKTLDKYKIKYIIWDQNIISPSAKNNDQVTFKNEITDILFQLENQNLIKKINQFGSLSIYENLKYIDGIEIKNINNFVYPSYQWGYFDPANLQNYITDNTNGIYFPFRDILDKNQKIDQNKIKIENTSQNEWQITLNTNNNVFETTKINTIESSIPAAAYLIRENNKLFIRFKFPLPVEILKSIKTDFEIPLDSINFKINNSYFPVNNTNEIKYLGLINIYANSDNYLNDVLIDFNFNSLEPIDLDKITFNSTSFDVAEQRHFKDKDSSNNYTVKLSKLPHSFGYIIGIKNKYFSGIPLRVCLKNNYSFLCSIEDELNKNKNVSWDYFLVPTTGNDFGYELSITNLSYGGLTSESVFNQISIIPIPFNFLSQIKSKSTDIQEKKYLIFNQSYHQFWKAFYFDNKKPVFLKNHVLANNWANAWELPAGKTPKIHIVFWPQIFEFIGFALLIPTIIWMFKKK